MRKEKITVQAFYIILILIFSFQLLNAQPNNKIEQTSQIVYQFPIQGAKYIKPEANLILRASVEVSPFSISAANFNVKGSISGSHDGKVILADDGRTIIFKPFTHFVRGEIVDVRLNTGITTITGKFIEVKPFSFSISNSDLKEAARKYYAEQLYNQLPHASMFKGDNFTRLNKSSSDLPSDFPPLTVDTLNHPSNGYLFLATFIPPMDSIHGRYLIIADNSGNPVYYKKMKDNLTDFKIQPNGDISYFNYSGYKFYVMNAALKIIDSVTAGNGEGNNVHELRMLTDGRKFILTQDMEIVDMSKIVAGGDTTAKVIGNGIQELDKDGNVIFDWRSWDHYKITDATHEDLTAKQIDYVHANAIEIDNDGNLLLSCRHLDEITKIDINTGDIIWRLGGKNNQFTFVNDSLKFSHQHDIRRQANGDITLFDDGNFHSPSFSRAVEYKLDETNKTAILVWQYRNDPDIYGAAMGSVERLAGGNTLIGWGTANETLTEVTPSGEITQAMHFPQWVWSYRAFKFPFLFIDTTLAGKNYESGKKATLSWRSSGIDSVSIDYSVDNGKSWFTIADNYPASKGSYDWIVPSVVSDSCRVRIVNADENSLPVKFLSRSTFSINSTSGVSTDNLPKEYSLENNYPNPFNPSTVISYQLPVESNVDIRIYNTLGQLVKNLVSSVQSAGTHNAVFKVDNLSSGVYIYSIKAVSVDGRRQFSSVKKMMLLK